MDSSEYQKQRLLPYLRSHLVDSADKYALVKAILLCYKAEILKITALGGFSMLVTFAGPAFILLL